MHCLSFFYAQNLRKNPKNPAVVVPGASFDGVGSEAVAFMESYRKYRGFLGRGVPERKNPVTRPIFARNLGIIHWKRAFRLLPSTGGEFFPVIVQHSTDQREGVRKMRPEQIVILALKAAASVIEEVVRKK